SLATTALVFAALTAMTRAGTYQPNKSRYLYIVVALTVPALGLAIDALTRARRWLVVPTSAILLVSAVGNARALLRYTNTPVARQGAVFGGVVLVAPPADVEKPAPPGTTPQPPQAATPPGGGGRTTTGCLLNNLPSNRPPPPPPLPADLAMDTIRLSLSPNT